MCHAGAEAEWAQDMLRAQVRDEHAQRHADTIRVVVTDEGRRGGLAQAASLYLLVT